MSNIDERKKQANNLLAILSDELDISGAKYQEAKERYNRLGDWLSRPESKVRSFSPEIYVQGSFLLGTVIKPSSEDGEYDIDSVCKVELTTAQCTQEQLKHLIGKEVKLYAKAQCMKKPVDEGKRCWTLNYADESRFHMDVLPAIPNAEVFREFLKQGGVTSGWTDDAIAITDNTHPKYKIQDHDWPVSNPKGYAAWFREQMKVASTRNFSGSALLTEKYASVEAVPTPELKTPLQRVIQLMKRHRDIRFDDSEDKPISIIITTLAAHAYNNEADVVEALVNVVDNMLDHIRDRNGEKWVANPVNPLENFADKWVTHPRRKKNFYAWHEDLRKHIHAMIAEETGLHNFSESLEKIAGKQTSNVVMTKYGNAMRAAREDGSLKASKGAAMLGATIGAAVKRHSFYGK
ncbi:MAG: nucleotidyltransferase [Kiritimatiellales bacterium]|nr:nucleotidyltransferase [Kiritimatiellales bacterium]